MGSRLRHFRSWRLASQSLYGAKVMAHAAHQDYLEIKLEKETEVRTLLVLATRFVLMRRDDRTARSTSTRLLLGSPSSTGLSTNK